ncbi:MAG: PAS domain-containing protein [Synergistaceae bacterium]|nr:PAS domain-containing protein [Synergistaceae bacterium]
MRWLYFPPVFSFFILMLTAILHRRDAAIYVPPPVWGMTIAAYIFMCAISLCFIMRDDDRYNFGISTFAQGLLLTVLSMQFGVNFLSLVGIVLFLVGLVSMFIYATNRISTDSLSSQMTETGSETSEQQLSRETLLEKLALPICYTDAKGVIAGATSAFSEVVGKEQADMYGMMINDVLPIDNDDAVFESGTWWITQTKDGARYYFSLSPTQDGKPVVASDESSAPSGILLHDQATGLYSDEYRKIRGPEEVSRAQRYKRQLSGLLLALTFEPASDVNLSPQQSDMLRNAFNMRVQSTLRTTDCGFLMNDGRIQILLPETPQAGAKTLMSRLTTLPQDVFDDEIRGAVNPKVRSGMFFYNGATRMEYGIFFASLEEAFLKSKEGAIEVSSNEAPSNKAA